MQLSMGLPDPREQSFLLLLRRVQAGIRQASAFKEPHHKRTKFLITLTVLRTIHSALNAWADPERVVTWAVASLAFFCFFQLSELLMDLGVTYS